MKIAEEWVAPDMMGLMRQITSDAGRVSHGPDAHWTRAQWPMLSSSVRSLSERESPAPAMFSRR